MNFFNRVYGKLFQTATNEQPLIYEILTRSKSYLESYQEWKETQLNKRLEDIYTAIILKQRGIEQQLSVHIVSGSSHFGIAISNGSYFEKKELSYLLDFFADKAKSFGYKTANADYLLRERHFGLEGTEKYYLKPIISGQAPYDQKFGNLLFEHILVNDDSSYLKITVTHYLDSAYLNPEPFEELLEHLFRN